MKNQLHVGTKTDLSFNLRHFWPKKSFRRPRLQRKTDCHFKISDDVSQTKPKTPLFYMINQPNGPKLASQAIKKVSNPVYFSKYHHGTYGRQTLPNSNFQAHFVPIEHPEYATQASHFLYRTVCGKCGIYGKITALSAKMITKWISKGVVTKPCNC